MAADTHDTDEKGGTEPPVLVIAAHGERGGKADNARLARIAAAVAALLPRVDVRHGVLSGQPSLPSVLPQAGPNVTVFPLFLSNGYFVREKLPAALEAQGVAARMLDPLGTGPDLALASAPRLLGLAGGRPSRVLVIAHGSTKDDRSRRDAERFGETLAQGLGGVPVSAAFLEEPPFAADAAAALPPDAAIVGLFAGEGRHGSEDMAEILERAGFPQGRVFVPAADEALVAAIIARRYAAT